MSELATATIVGVPIALGSYQYTITLTNTGTAPLGIFWFAWDDAPEQDFMNQAPTITGEPDGWVARTTTASEPGGIGYGIQWYTFNNASRLGSGSVTSSFTFTSGETPAKLAAASPFDASFLTSSSFVYETASFQPAVGDNGYNFVAGVACFHIGTRVAVVGGEVPIELVRQGDLVLTESGEERPVCWIGRRRIRCDRHPNPEQVWPVRVARGALGPGVPRSDLYVSPDHALALDGVLISVRHLINGDTIMPVPVDDAIYYHLELASHDVILAEGAPAETWLDTGDRLGFEPEIVRLLPDARAPGWVPIAREAASCRDVVVTGPVLATIRGRLAERAALVVAEPALSAA